MEITTFRDHINIPLQTGSIEGDLVIPSGSATLVLFSHGSGSSRFSSRNNYVASLLHQRGISTFLLDLLTPEEDKVYANRFNILLLTERLVLATENLLKHSVIAEMEMGYFGASTGAASALGAAAQLPEFIKVVVSRGGRPDLIADVLPDVKAATLLIVGELDEQVLELNRFAYRLLQCEKRLEVIPGATHLFEEEGTLTAAGTLAAGWFCSHFYTFKRDQV